MARTRRESHCFRAFKDQFSGRSWWDGGSRDDPIQTAYNVVQWPTIFVLDEGVIRSLDVHAKALDEVVDKLLAEAEQNQKGP